MRCCGCYIGWWLFGRQYSTESLQLVDDALLFTDTQSPVNTDINVAGGYSRPALLPARQSMLCLYINRSWGERDWCPVTICKGGTFRSDVIWSVREVADQSCKGENDKNQYPTENWKETTIKIKTKSGSSIAQTTVAIESRVEGCQKHQTMAEQRANSQQRLFFHSVIQSVTPRRKSDENRWKLVGARDGDTRRERARERESQRERARESYILYREASRIQCMFQTKSNEARHWNFTPSYLDRSRTNRRHIYHL